VVDAGSSMNPVQAIVAVEAPLHCHSLSVLGSEKKQSSEKN